MYLLFCSGLLKLHFLIDYKKNTYIIRLMKTPPLEQSGTTNRRTDIKKLMVASRNFVTAIETRKNKLNY
jgi:hypothetical protein